MRRLAALVALAITAVAAPARAQQPTVTIDFAEYSSPVSRDYAAAIGQPLRSKGFDFYVTDAFIPGARNALSTWGTNPSDNGFTNQPTNRRGSTAMAATQPGDEIDMYIAGTYPLQSAAGLARSGKFNLYSMDFAHLYSTEYVPVLQDFDLTVYGITASGRGIEQTFRILAPAPIGGVSRPTLQTFAFDNRWRGLVNVYWSQTVTALSQAHQFSNVRAQVTPEPSTYALLAVGLGGVLVVARRRRTTPTA